MSFEIVTDTSANLPAGIAAGQGVTVLPFSCFINGKAFAFPDPDKFDGPGFYAMMRGGIPVTTSLISPGEYAGCFRLLLEQGRDVLYIGMSSGISGSFASAAGAAELLREEYPERKIRLVDSLGASLGEGLLVLRALEDRDKGMGLDAVFGHLNFLRHRIYQVFTVDDLAYLRQGGRLSSMAAIMGTVLHIKPILKGNEEGKIVGCRKVPGRKKAIEELARRYEELAVNPEEQTAGIAHADCPEDASALEKLLRSGRPPKEIITVCYEPVTGCHVGPGALALFFEGVRDARKM